MGASRDKLRAHRQQDWFALCYADQAVRRATEAISTFFANLRAHIHLFRFLNAELFVTILSMQPLKAIPSLDQKLGRTMQPNYS